MWVVNNRKIFYTFSLILVVASFVSLFVWGLLPGVDFTGGTLVEVAYKSGRPEQAIVTQSLVAIDKNASLRLGTSADGLDSYIVRMRTVDQTEKVAVMKALATTDGQAPVLKAFDSIGPILGAEALRKAYWSIIMVILAIVIYITFAFRKVSEPVSSWKYGLIAIIALIHDVVIPVGAFSILGHYFGYEVDTLFVTALLVVLGFSVHDTIVVFDRVRENLSHGAGKESFAQIVGKSISQKFARSINTSLTTLIALVVLYIFGGSVTQHFTLALIIGIAAGTYSSVFIGSPLLVTFEGWTKKSSK